MLPAEFHPVTPESLHAALEARATELQAAAKANDGQIHTPQEIVVMPLGIKRGESVEMLFRHLELLEQRYSWPLLRYAMESRLAAGECK